MKILILGGSRFMGRLLTERLLKQPKYDLTLFNRGKTDPHLFPTVKRILGDRETEDIQQILKQQWDTIVDFSAYQPATLESLIKQLKGKVGRYIFISTISTYPNETEGVKNEEVPISPCTAEQRGPTAVTATNYGPKKAECERILLAEDWLDALILRPSVVYGRYDYTQRLYYWLYRAKTQKRIMLPDNGDELFNMTSVEDMVEILLQSLEIEQHQKVYNTTTHLPNTLSEKLDIMCRLLGTTPTFISVPQAAIIEAKERLGGHPPCWRTNDNMRFDHSRLLSDFPIRLDSFEESIRKMIAYHDQNGLWEEGGAGPKVKEEQAFLDDFLKM